MNMKIVVLVDSSNGDFEEMAEIVDNKKPVLISTEGYDEKKEYRRLLKSIENFSNSSKEVLLAQFSGNESVPKKLGDQCSEMILTLSDNKNSMYYTGCPVNLFSDLVSIFERGDLIHGTTIKKSPTF